MEDFDVGCNRLLLVVAVVAVVAVVFDDLWKIFQGFCERLSRNLKDFWGFEGFVERLLKILKDSWELEGLLRISKDFWKDY